VACSCGGQDEIHDLVDGGADGKGTAAQNNFMQVKRKARNVWLMSATPFPKVGE